MEQFSRKIRKWGEMGDAECRRNRSQNTSYPSYKSFTEIFKMGEIVPYYLVKMKSQENQSLKKHWSLVRVWSDKSRYNSGKTLLEAQNFFISVREVSLWIRKHL